MNYVQTIDVEVGAPLERNASGAITGRVVIRVGDTAFPDSGWLDFLDVLPTWVEAVASQSRATLYFIDGPYEVRIGELADDGDTAELALVARSAGGDRILKQAQISTTQLRRALRRACESVAAKLKEAGQVEDSRVFREAGARI